MKRAAAVVALGVLGALAVGALADATQSRPDARRDADSTTIITFTVGTRGFPSSADPGLALWTACQGTFSAHTMGLRETAPGNYRATVQPSLGKLAQRRLTGCLDDATVDRLGGRVIGTMNIYH